MMAFYSKKVHWIAKATRVLDLWQTSWQELRIAEAVHQVKRMKNEKLFQHTGPVWAVVGVVTLESFVDTSLS